MIITDYQLFTKITLKSFVYLFDSIVKYLGIRGVNPKSELSLYQHLLYFGILFAKNRKNL